MSPKVATEFSVDKSASVIASLDTLAYLWEFHKKVGRITNLSSLQSWYASLRKEVPPPRSKGRAEGAMNEG